MYHVFFVFFWPDLLLLSAEKQSASLEAPSSAHREFPVAFADDQDIGGFLVNTVVRYLADVGCRMII